MSRTWLRWISLLLLSWLFISAAISGVAYVVQYRANATVDRWQQSAPGSVNLVEWQHALGEVNGILFWDQYNPDLNNVLGRLFDFHAVFLSATQEERVSVWGQAADSYREVIRLRPAWPYGYLNLALLKASAGQFDREYEGLLLQLHKLGPWEEKVLPNLVQLSTYSWSKLSSDERKQLTPYLLQAAKNRTHEVRQALGHSQGLQYFCMVIARDQSLTLCPSL